ncbi:MAG: biotin/lipoyl-containing protein, partial [Thiobacillus sp.]|nr:biotin/lipoyl-containing protein [Thiobacillus sp.]
MKLEVRVPTLSDSVASGTLLPWRKQVGETVARDETLVDLETDKVILEIPAPASGTLVEVRQPEGAVVKADEVVAVIETGEGVAAAAPAEKPAQPVAATTVAPTAVVSPVVSVPLPAAAAEPVVAPGERGGRRFLAPAAAMVLSGFLSWPLFAHILAPFSLGFLE